MKTVLWGFAALILLAIPGAAQLYWGDNFENLGGIGSPSGPYTPGPVPSFPDVSGAPPYNANPVNGGWDVWYHNAAAQGAISASPALGSKSLCIAGPGVAASGCDVVADHSAATAVTGNPGMYNHAAFGANAWPGNAPGGPPGLGTWQYRAWNFCPSSFPTGTSSHYFIVNDLMNNSTSGPTRWIMQVQFNHVTGTVADDHRPIPAPVPIRYDTWVEVVATFDLDNGYASVTYGGDNIGNGVLFVPTWNAGGPAQIANLDLYTQGATSFWDNVTLTRIIDGPQFDTNSAAASADLNGVQGNCCGFAETRIAAGLPVSLNLNMALPSPGHEAVIDAGTPIPRGSPGCLELAPGAILNINLYHPTTFFLYGGTLPFFLPYPGGPMTSSFIAGPSGLSASVQFLELDFASPNGFELTQPCNLHVP